MTAWSTEPVGASTDGRHISFFFSGRRRHTRFSRDWSSDVCSSDLAVPAGHVVDEVGECLRDRDAGTPLEQRVHVVRGVSGVEREIGRASCREKVETSGGAGSLKKKKGRRTREGTAAAAGGPPRVSR